MRKRPFSLNKVLIIVLISILSIIALGIFLYHNLRQYEKPNAKINELSFPNPTLQLYYSYTDQQNTTRLYSQLINGTGKKLLYERNPRFQHQLLKSIKKILILQRDRVLLIDENGNIDQEFFVSPSKKWIGEESWQVSTDENLVSFMLYDDDYKVEPIGYEVDLKTETYKMLTTEVNPSYPPVYEAISPNGSRKANIKEGSLFVDDKELIHWQNYSYKLNPGCSYPQWLPFEDYLTVSCMGSLRIVQISSGKNAELDKGGKVDWFN